MNKKDLVKKFQGYPDLVTIPQFCEMLGGICENSARKIIRGKHIKYLYVRYTYLIPKKYVIEYVCSPHYKKFSKTLKHKI